MKKLFKLLPLLLALLVFCACTANPKDFEAAGLTITLTDDFAREDSLNEGQDAVFVSDDAVVSVLCVKFNQTGVDPSMTEESYAQFVNLVNEREVVVLHRDSLLRIRDERREISRRRVQGGRCLLHGAVRHRYGRFRLQP